jgi:uncharacterized protein
MSDLLDLLDDRAATTIAVVGATDDPGKYGGIMYRDLKGKGYRVYAVNPGRATVDGDPCYDDLDGPPEPPTIVCIVVPPKVTLGVLRRCLDLGLTRVWIQPGAADASVRSFVEENGFTAVIDACIMLETTGG